MSSHISEILDNAYHDHPCQMPDGPRHDRHVKSKLVGAALHKELPLKEHAGPLAELNNGA